MKFIRVRTLLSVACLLARLLTAEAYADTAGSLSKDDVQRIVKEYLLKHPETIQASLRAGQSKELARRRKLMQQAARQHQDDLFHSGNYPSAGDAFPGNVTITEFYDFHCGFCKQMVPTLTKLLQEDKHVRVVFRDFPILAPDSELAAKASVAFYRLNKEKYFDFYCELMKSTGHFEDKSIQAIAAKFRVDGDALKAEMDKPETAAAIATNKDLGKALAISGTPTLYVDTIVLDGSTPYDKLKAVIDKLRKQKDAAGDP